MLLSYMVAYMVAYLSHWNTHLVSVANICTVLLSTGAGSSCHAITTYNSDLGINNFLKLDTCG